MMMPQQTCISQTRRMTTCFAAGVLTRRSYLLAVIFFRHVYYIKITIWTWLSHCCLDVSDQVILGVGHFLQTYHSVSDTILKVLISSVTLLLYVSNEVNLKELSRIVSPWVRDLEVINVSLHFNGKYKFLTCSKYGHKQG